MSTIILYKQAGIIHYENGTTKLAVPEVNFTMQDAGSGKVFIAIKLIWAYGSTPIIENTVVLASSILDHFGNPYGNTYHDVVDRLSIPLEVNLMPKTSNSMFVKFNKITNSTTLSLAASFLTPYTLNLTSATGAAVGRYLILFYPAGKRYATFTIIGVNGTVITVDRYIDYEYPAGSYVDIAITNMAVDGSVTPQVFGLRGLGVIPGIDVTANITRLIFTCLTVGVVSLAKFGDLPSLLRGLLFRKRNDSFHNEFVFKNNRELAGLLYDWTPYAATNPAQGQNGFVSRLTYGSDQKVGVIIELPVGYDAEFIVQDALQTITSLEVVAEGYITYNY